MNYFELLDMREEYAIDLQQLSKQYLGKQILYHPDRAKDVTQKNEYQNISMNLNKAYSVLKNDLKRAKYILSLKNIHIDDLASRSRISNDELSKIWQEREKIENFDDNEELQEFLTQKLMEQKVLTIQLNDAFQAKNFQDALDITVSFKYLMNLIENIKLKMKDANNRD